MSKVLGSAVGPLHRCVFDGFGAILELTEDRENVCILGGKSVFLRIFLDFQENRAPRLINGFAWNPREKFGNFVKISIFLDFLVFDQISHVWHLNITRTPSKPYFFGFFGQIQNQPPRLHAILGQKWTKSKKSLKNFEIFTKIPKFCGGFTRIRL